MGVLRISYFVLLPGIWPAKKGNSQMDRDDDRDSFQERLLTFRDAQLKKASTLPPGPEKEAALLRIRQAEAAAELDEWASSEGRLTVQMSDVVSLQEKVVKAESTTK